MSCRYAPAPFFPFYITWQCRDRWSKPAVYVQPAGADAIADGSLWKLFTASQSTDEVKNKKRRVYYSQPPFQDNAHSNERTCIIMSFQNLTVVVRCMRVMHATCMSLAQLCIGAAHIWRTWSVASVHAPLVEAFVCHTILHMDLQIIMLSFKRFCRCTRFRLPCFSCPSHMH